MASIEISLKEIVKLINYYLNEEEVEEIRDLRLEKNRIQFSYNPGSLIPNIPLSIKINSFEEGELILELREHSPVVPEKLGAIVLEKANPYIESFINGWLLGEDYDDSDNVCRMEENYIYIPIESLEYSFFGDYPFKIKDIIIENGGIHIVFKI